MQLLQSNVCLKSSENKFEILEFRQHGGVGGMTWKLNGIVQRLSCKFDNIDIEWHQSEDYTWGMFYYLINIAYSDDG